MNNNSTIQIPLDLSGFLNAAITVLNVAIKDPIDEIRGHLTAQILRSWIIDNRTKADYQSKSCVVNYYPAEQKVIAFIADEKGEILFTDKGLKILVAFMAKSLDQELMELFANSKTILIPLN